MKSEEEDEEEEANFDESGEGFGEGRPGVDRCVDVVTPDASEPEDARTPSISTRRSRE